MKVRFFTKYGRKGASSRLRTYQYLDAMPHLAGRASALFSDRYVESLYARQRRRALYVLEGYLRRLSELVRPKNRGVGLVVEKELFPWVPWFIEKQFLKGHPYVVDIDDAVFHSYDSGIRKWVLGNKHRHLFRNSACVIAGNEYLAQYARGAGANAVVIIPTVVSVRRYSVEATTANAGTPVIVWIGSPSTQSYLENLLPALDILAQTHTFEVRAIGCDISRFPKRGYLKHLKWSEATEVQLLSSAHVGVMPLVDAPFERGKCGYKLVQYMASRLPVVASPVGVNRELVRQGWNGFLCGSSEEWATALRELISNPELREQMGRNGAQLVTERYSLEGRMAEYETTIRTALSRASTAGVNQVRF